MEDSDVPPEEGFGLPGTQYAASVTNLDGKQICQRCKQVYPASTTFVKFRNKDREQSVLQPYVMRCPLCAEYTVNKATTTRVENSESERGYEQIPH